MKSWLGSYCPAPGAEPLPVTVLAFEKKITIGLEQADGSAKVLAWDMRDLQPLFDQSLQATRIGNAREGDGRLIIEGKEPLDYVTAMQAEQNKAWHQQGKVKEWGRNLLVIAGIAASLLIAYVLLVPWLSEKMASTVPVETEEQFGDAVYNALQLSAREDRQATRLLEEFVVEMKLPATYDIRVTVVNDEIENAFALPGGHIVIYSALLRKLQTYPELAALLSHEFVHVNNKHATRSIFRQLGSRVFVSLLFGKFGSVASVMVDQADKLKALKYSRSLEKEADLDGLKLLQERKIDPGGFARLFQHLGEQGPEPPEWLVSHPGLDNRIVYIRQAAAGARIEENIQLKAIFDKLNKNI